MNGLSNRRKLSKNHCWLRVRTKVWNDRLQALSHSVALEADDGDLETFKEASMMGRVVAPYIASPPWSTMVHHVPPWSTWIPGPGSAAKTAAAAELRDASCGDIVLAASVANVANIAS